MIRDLKLFCFFKVSDQPRLAPPIPTITILSVPIFADAVKILHKDRSLIINILHLKYSKDIFS